MVSLDRTAADAGATPATVQALMSLKQLKGLSDEEYRRLADFSRIETFAPGAYVTTEGGEESLYGFIVISGRLAMTKSSINGKELIVELLAPGDIFGILLMLSSERQAAQVSVRAHSSSQILWVPLSSLLPIVRAHPELSREFVTHLLHALHSSYRLARGLAHDRVSVRIATVLVTLALKFARPPLSNQEHVIDITRQKIADLTGTTGESAIRVTRRMQKDGLIDIKRPGIVRVIDLDGLQRIAEAD